MKLLAVAAAATVLYVLAQWLRPSPPEPFTGSVVRLDERRRDIDVIESFANHPSNH